VQRGNEQLVFLRNPANIKGMAETSFPKKSTCCNTLIFGRLRQGQKGLLTETKVMAQIKM
jgi:hypothetical protein